MEKLIKIFGRAVGNGRYIKLDGSAYHSKPLRAFFERPETKFGLGALALQTAANTFFTGSADEQSSTALVQFVKDSGWLTVALGFTFIAREVDSTTITTKDAIDTTGTDLSRRDLTLNEAIHLESTWTVSQIGCAFHTLFGALTLASGSTPVFSATLAVMYLSRYYTANSLLNGSYVFCDKPPGKVEKAKTYMPVGAVPQVK